MIRMIAARDTSRAIATDSGIPWTLPGDAAYFEQQITDTTRRSAEHTTLIPLQVHPDVDDTFCMTQDVDEVPPSSWHERLESFTKQHKGDVVTIEVLSLDLGDEYRG